MAEPTRLAQLRGRREWSQARLAERSAVSRAEISAIETGRLVPSVAVALRLAAALGEPVEAVFGESLGAPAPAWAWTPGLATDGRVWHALVGGRTVLYPVEPTAMGVLAHDACYDGRRLDARAPDSPPERTLVVAGCDPLVGLLARALMVHHRVRLVPLLRSSGRALDLLAQGHVHVAGLHFADASGRSTNEAMVRSALGPGHRLLHQVRWDAGVAVRPERGERTLAGLLRAKVRWVNREEGSAARRTFDTLLASRQRPAGYDHVVRDHRAVAATVSSGWAEAGVCVRPAAAEARLSFIRLKQETYELCVPESLGDDPRLVALVAVLQSSSYRRLLADVPGCVTSHTGDIRSIA